MLRIIPILLGVTISYAAALILNAVGMTNADGSAILDFSGAAAANLVGLPPFQLCKFNLTAILAMAPIAIAAMMEHIGDISAISATVGENFMEDPGLQRTLIGDGLATSLSALVGGPANTTYGENTGVLELSRVHDPRVIRIAAVFACNPRLYSEGSRADRFHADGHRWRRQLHPLRYDFRHRCT